MTDTNAQRAAWTSPGTEIKFPREARIGMALINRLVTIGAPEPKIIAMVAATATKMSPALARIWIADAHRIGLISEQARDQCIRHCEKHFNTSLATVH